MVYKDGLYPVFELPLNNPLFKPLCCFSGELLWKVEEGEVTFIKLTEKVLYTYLVRKPERFNVLFDQCLRECFAEGSLPLAGSS